MNSPSNSLLELVAYLRRWPADWLHIEGRMYDTNVYTCNSIYLVLSSLNYACFQSLAIYLKMYLIKGGCTVISSWTKIILNLLTNSNISSKNILTFSWMISCLMAVSYMIYVELQISCTLEKVHIERKSEMSFCWNRILSFFIFIRQYLANCKKCRLPKRGFAHITRVM